MTLLFILGACGGGGGGGGSNSATTYTVGGSVSGLSGTLVLRNNGGDDRTLSTNGAFRFATALTDQDNYSVTVATQPLNQTCTVTNGSGAISGANVTGVGIACTTTGAGVLRMFAAADGVHGPVLWKTDGTANGTVLVKVITTGAGSFSDSDFIDLNGTWYFAADDGVHGMELWKSDGTEAGTLMVKDINPNANSGLLTTARLTMFNNAVYFTADDGAHGVELWKSDGTDAGTVMVKDIESAAGEGSRPQQLTVFNGALYFVAFDLAHGGELWKTDGSEAGTVLVRDINPAAGQGSGEQGAGPLALTVFNNALYFLANDGVTGNGLWKTDGTGSGTVLVKNMSILAGVQTSLIRYFAVFNNTLYFAGDDDMLLHRYELWKSDGTNAGTVLIKRINTTTLSGSSPGGFTVFNGALYFVADDGVVGNELWKTDGTSAGTGLVKDFNNVLGAGSPHNFFAFNGTLYFSANDPVAGQELWKTDGTDAGTVLVKDINTNTKVLGGYSNPKRFFVLNGALYFEAVDGAHGNELWTTDGTTAGTQLLKDICPGACNGPPN